MPEGGVRLETVVGLLDTRPRPTLSSKLPNLGQPFSFGKFPMLRQIVVAAAFSLIVCAGRGRGADAGATDLALVHRLLDSIRNNKDLRVRAAALGALNSLSTKDGKAAKALKVGLKGFLTKPPVSDYDRAFLPYVIKALGKMGAPARDVLPDLAELKGIDVNMDKAIDEAVSFILKPQASPAKGIKDLQDDLKKALEPPRPPTQDYVIALVDILKSPKNPVSMRVMAAKAIGLAARSGESTTQKLAAEALQKVAAEPMVDDDLKVIASNALKHIKGGKE
jgi:hypothetical protein